MRTLLTAAALILAPAALAHGQSGVKPAAPAAATAGHYSTSSTEIGVLLDDPAAKAVIEKHIPGMTTNEQIDMARAMTLKDVQQYSPDQVTDKVLAEIDTDLTKLPVKTVSQTK